MGGSLRILTTRWG